jgi:ABC-type lipoprotein release transport system permease subunit
MDSYPHTRRDRRRRGVVAARLIAVALVLVTTQTGCLAIGLSLFGVAAGVGTGTAVSYAMNGFAYRTVTAPLPKVEVAAVRTIHGMGFKLTSREPTETGKTLHATGNDRDIEVRLERVTDKTTRIRTVVSQGALLRDRATATEIIVQTEEALGRT